MIRSSRDRFRHVVLIRCRAIEYDGAEDVMAVREDIRADDNGLSNSPLDREAPAIDLRAEAFDDDPPRALGRRSAARAFARLADRDP